MGLSDGVPDSLSRSAPPCTSSSTPLPELPGCLAPDLAETAPVHFLHVHPDRRTHRATLALNPENRVFLVRVTSDKLCHTAANAPFQRSGVGYLKPAPLGSALIDSQIPKILRHRVVSSRIPSTC